MRYELLKSFMNIEKGSVFATSKNNKTLIYSPDNVYDWDSQVRIPMSLIKKDWFKKLPEPKHVPHKPIHVAGMLGLSKLGYNAGLDKTFSNPWDYDEEVKRQGVTPIGDAPLNQVAKTENKRSKYDFEK